MREMVVDSVRLCPTNNFPRLFLKCKGLDLYLAIFISAPEADAIAAKLMGLSTSRPLTHDTLATLINALEGTVEYVLINDVRHDVAHANIFLQARHGNHEIDSRPGDAVAAAMRVQAPIYAAEAVLDVAAWAWDDETGALVPPEQNEMPGCEPLTPVTQKELERISAFTKLINNLDLEDFAYTKSQGGIYMDACISYAGFTLALV